MGWLKVKDHYINLSLTKIIKISREKERVEFYFTDGSELIVGAKRGTNLLANVIIPSEEIETLINALEGGGIRLKHDNPVVSWHPNLLYSTFYNEY